MRHRSFLVPGALLSLFFLGGCVQSEQPLSPLENAKPDLRLVGRWQQHAEPGAPTPAPEEKSAPPCRVSFDEHGIGTAEFTPEGQERPQAIHFTITRTPKHSLLSIKAGDSPVPMYKFYKYEVTLDGRLVRLWSVRSTLFEEAVRTRQLKGKLTNDEEGNVPDEEGNYTTLQDTADHVLAFVESKSDKEIFEEFLTVEKIN